MKRVCRSISSALLFLLIFQPFSAAETREAKRVLVLHSEDKASPGPEMAEQGIRADFSSNKLFDHTTSWYQIPVIFLVINNSALGNVWLRASRQANQGLKFTGVSRCNFNLDYPFA